MTFVTITSAAFMTPAPSLTRELYCADRSIPLICIKTANPLLSPLGSSKSKQDCRRERVVKIKPEKAPADQATDLLMLDLRHEGNNVTALLAPKG